MPARTKGHGHDADPFPRLALSHGNGFLRPHAEYVPKFLWAIASVHFKRINLPVLKTAMGRESHRGFESHTLRRPAGSEQQ